MHLLHKLGVGGMEVGVVKLANLLPRHSVATSICSLMPADGLTTRLAPEVPLYELTRRPGNDLRLVLQLAGVLRRARPDVLHTHSWATLCEGLVAARLAGVPVVVHGEHGTLETRPRNRRIQRWAWQRCDRVLSVSSRLAERMSAEMGFPLERITTIRNGVDLPLFASADRGRGRRALGLDPAQLVIGTVGRLVPVKGHETLLHALAQLRDRGRSYQAVIVGDGILRAQLESRVRELGLGGAVHLAGHREQVADALAAMDLFVLPSISEGLSNTILEAMAAGLPVVATRVGGADELVSHGRTGLLVPSGDVDALARALDDVARCADTRAAMGAEGRRLAEREFSLEGMVANYERLYHAVRPRHGSAPEPSYAH
jgi:sugar transferase (PEP-CTERM/EpsH1 system associated)